MFLVQNIIYSGFFVANVTHLYESTLEESEIPHYQYLWKVNKTLNMPCHLLVVISFDVLSLLFFCIYFFLSLGVEFVIRITVCEYFLNHLGNVCVWCALPFCLTCKLQWNSDQAGLMFLNLTQLFVRNIACRYVLRILFLVRKRPLCVQDNFIIRTFKNLVTSISSYNKLSFKCEHPSQITSALHSALFPAQLIHVKT